MRRVQVVVDGVRREADAGPETTLLALLRDAWGLTATKHACEEGECGSCSVLLDGELVCACLVPAVQADGAAVRTVASLTGERLHPLQEAFVAAGAVQCGYCTPGMLVAAAALLERDSDPDDAAIGVALAGNLCRCTGYRKIVDAVHLAAGAAR